MVHAIDEELIIDKVASLDTTFLISEATIIDNNMIFTLANGEKLSLPLEVMVKSYQ